MAEIREIFMPYNILVWYSGVVLDHDSQTDSNEYEWGPDVLSTTSSKEYNENQEVITKEDLSIAKQKMKLETRQEKLRIQRKEAYAKRKGKDKDKEVIPQELQTRIDQAFENTIFSSKEEQDVSRYGRTIEELRDSQVGLTISPKEVEFERRQNPAKESSLSCTKLCQLQNANEVNQEGICSIKDVCVDIIHSFKGQTLVEEPLECELQNAN